MDFSEYQTRTAETAIYPNIEIATAKLLGMGYTDEQIQEIICVTHVDAIGLSYVGLGLGEAGEVQGKIKKVLRDDGGKLSQDKREAIAAELGDLLWYVSQTATELGVDLGNIAQGNLDKLASRQQRGVLGGSGDNR